MKFITDFLINARNLIAVDCYVEGVPETVCPGRRRHSWAMVPKSDLKPGDNNFG